MLQFDKIFANARYEIKTLLRSWFFRIYSGLAIFIFIILDIIFFSGVAPLPRAFYGLSASAPYTNMLMLNLAQIVMAVLLSSDLLKRDKRMNTVEVFYIRSMANASYVLGKALGVLIVFGALNLLILCIGGVIHIVFGGADFSWQSYILCFILIPFPSFIFMTGLSLLLIRLIKNQAVVVLLSLGYFAASLFYLRDRLFFIFDFAAINLPMTYSDFNGIANLTLILYQRGLYVLLGLVFLFLTVLLFSRLSQSSLTNRILGGMIIILTLLSGFFVHQYLRFYFDGQLLRQRMKILNTEYAEKQNVTPESCQIDLIHDGDKIKASAVIVFHNQHNKPLHNYFFSLNPGLRVAQINANSKAMKYKQANHLIIISPDIPLQPGHRDSIRIAYSGAIDEAACYLDISDSKMQEINNIWIYQVYKKYAFLSNRFVLLTPESMWYPNAVLPLTGNFQQHNNGNFVDYKLTVSTAGNLLPVSQGATKIIKPGVTMFKPEQPLSRLSLIIGPYTQRSIRVDSIDYHLYIHSGHTYFDEYFTEIEDTLGSIISEAKQDYEVKLNLEYPFKRLSLIEIPIQFYAYPRITTVAREFIQPEQIWIPENGTITTFADFKLMNRFIERRMDRSNQTQTDTELQTSLLKQFIYNTFLGESSFSRMLSGMVHDYKPDLNLYPSFYSYTNYLHSKNWPVFYSALEAYLFDRVSTKNTDPRASFFEEGLTETEKVNLLLAETSLAELLTSMEESDLLPQVIKSKGAYLFKLFQTQTGADTFDTYTNKFVNSSRFKTMDTEDFLKNLKNADLSEIHSTFENWYYGKELPGFFISDIQMFKIIDNDRMRYQVLFEISNPEIVGGLVEVQFQFGRFGRRMMAGPSVEEEPARLIKLASGESKEIGFVLDSEPRSVNISCLIARNIPLNISKRFDKAELKESYSAFDGERIVKSFQTADLPKEIIVDNEDEGFRLFNPPYQSWLKRLIQGDQTEDENNYTSLNRWSAPARWSLIKNSALYGKYIHSGYYIKAGDGDRKVTWQAKIPRDGIYDIYTYTFNIGSFFGRRTRRDGRPRNTKYFGEFTYNIYHEGGSDRITLDVSNTSDGWQFLGTYYLTKNTAKVELTDKSNGRLVLADAIKWVKN